MEMESGQDDFNEIQMWSTAEVIAKAQRLVHI